MKYLLAALLTLFITAGFSSAYAGTKSPVVNKRQVVQNHRIDQGVKSGQLTPAESHRLKVQQAKIRHDEARMKSDGVLTVRERAKLDREQDRASKNIYRKKHNSRTAN